MTNQQIIALIVICTFVAGLFTYAYLIGRHTGHERGKTAASRMHEETIQKLNEALEFLRDDHRHLAQHAKKLKEMNALQEHHHCTLLQIAENLRIAAETWSAFKTGKKLERDARRLRDEALAIAESLMPVLQKAAA